MLECQVIPLKVSKRSGEGLFLPNASPDQRREQAEERASESLVGS